MTRNHPTGTQPPNAGGPRRPGLTVLSHVAPSGDPARGAEGEGVAGLGQADGPHAGPEGDGGLQAGQRQVVAPLHPPVALVDHHLHHRPLLAPFLLQPQAAHHCPPGRGLRPAPVRPGGCHRCHPIPSGHPEPRHGCPSPGRGPPTRF